MTETNLPPEEPAPELPPPAPAVRVIKPRPLIVRLITEHNPFYLLSAACMLASCLALTNTTTWNPIASSRILKLIVTLNVYEITLLAIALFLISRRQLFRDGRILLLLQAFFLADFTFLNAEIATATRTVLDGLLVNVVLFALAAAKMGAVLRVLRPTFTRVQFAFVMVQLAILFGVASLFRWINVHAHAIGPRDFYVLWWVMALLPALYELLASVDWRRNVALSVTPRAQTAPTTTYLALPYVSLVIHVSILQYVYDTPFYGANAAPLLLGLTLVLNRANPTTLMPRKDLAALRFLLPLAAVLVSANNPFSFVARSAYPTLRLTTLNLAIAGAFLTYVYCFLMPYARLFLATGAVAAGVYVLGPSRQQMADGIQATWNWLTETAQRLMPKTTGDWGLVGLVASFAFLGIGFWVSLRRRPVATAGVEPDEGS